MIASTQIVGLERKVDLAVLDTKLLVLNSSSKAMQGEVDEIKVWFRQVWPRLRQHGENAEILRHAIIRTHPEIKLELVDPDSINDK